MRAEMAVDIARNLYDDHPAAAALMLEAIHGATRERRERSALALRCLDPDEALSFLELPGGPAWTAAQSLAYLLIGNISATRDQRKRVASLLGAVCRAAASLRSLESAA